MASTGDTWRLGHRPALDGLRGVAVLLVLASHTPFHRLVGAGGVGVTLFFVLSGFLITALLLEEKADTGRISVAAFYQRRARRLLPALAAFLVVMLAAVALLGATYGSLRQALLAAVYLGNLPAMADAPVNAMSHTWSLAVEEQFYILYPVLLLVLGRLVPRHALLLLVGAGVAFSVAVRWGLWENGEVGRAYAGTDTNAAALLAGCAVALWMHGQHRERAAPAALASLALAPAAFFALAGEGFSARVAGPVTATFMGAVAVGVIANGGGPGWMQTGWLTLVGRRSYGFYLWHFPVVGYAVPSLGLPLWIGVPVGVAASWGLTVLSWRYIEQPARRWRITPSPFTASHRSGSPPAKRSGLRALSS